MPQVTFPPVTLVFMEMKNCNRCETDKPEDKRHFDWVPPGSKGGTKGYYRQPCKKCRTKQQVERMQRYKTDDTPRICATCGIPGTRATFKGSYCLPCERVRQAGAMDRMMARKGGSYRYRRNLYLKRAYGITIEEYEEMLAAQNGRCAICGAEEGAADRLSLCVDHNHATGRRRELLCIGCNFRVRNLGDDRELFELTVAYIRKHEFV
ncbi:MAG: hypothetical protein JWM19_873 [Actinomycetia bacterium]|nr:hypothetical protein [Actinomycetes bacterium]